MGQVYPNLNFIIQYLMSDVQRLYVQVKAAHLQALTNVKEAAKDLTSGLQTLDKEAEAQVAQVVGAANANVKGILGRFKIHL